MTQTETPADAIPDMLEALRKAERLIAELVQFVEVDPADTALLDVREALAKATGGAA